MKCQEANHVCDKTQYKEATLWEKIKLNIHLLYCRACRKYTSDNTKLSDFIQKSNVQTISTTDKDNLKELVKNEMSK